MGAISHAMHSLMASTSLILIILNNIFVIINYFLCYVRDENKSNCFELNWIELWCYNIVVSHENQIHSNLKCGNSKRLLTSASFDGVDSQMGCFNQFWKISLLVMEENFPYWVQLWDTLLICGPLGHPAS